VKTPKLSPKVYRVPTTIDEQVAILKLNAMRIKIDTLTPAQKEYIESWKAGTV
jgi:adenosylhomocysteinase